jgi:toxin FitB
MTGFLLDTNVISELRRFRPHGAVLTWFKSVNERDLFLSTATVQEIQAGIEITRDNDASRAQELDDWLSEIIGSFSILAADGPIMRLTAKIMHRKQERLFSDAIIAATALVHGLTIATRNGKDFRQFEAPVFNPFESARS